MLNPKKWVSIACPKRSPTKCPRPTKLLGIGLIWLCFWTLGKSRNPGSVEDILLVGGFYPVYGIPYPSDKDGSQLGVWTSRSARKKECSKAPTTLSFIWIRVILVTMIHQHPANIINIDRHSTTIGKIHQPSVLKPFKCVRWDEGTLSYHPNHQTMTWDIQKETTTDCAVTIWKPVEAMNSSVTYPLVIWYSCGKSPQRNLHRLSRNLWYHLGWTCKKEITPERNYSLVYWGLDTIFDESDVKKTRKKTQK